ncbi:MAG: hypothetical protein E6R03_13650 [Hyphomicrobiaceae bacterium]|nr:MAG: hypothetical protein E6R03_13650 [Hyphomicrobiaceae bacterium]
MSWKGGSKSGTKFENLVNDSFKNIEQFAFHVNANSILKPACDHRVAFRGLSFMIEDKKTNSENTSLSLSVLSSDQVQWLDRHDQAGGGVSALCFRVVWPNKSRCWIGRWDDIKDYCARHNRKSIPLRPVPDIFTELHQIERPNGLGKCYDMLPWLDMAWHRKLEEILSMAWVP